MADKLADFGRSLKGALFNVKLDGPGDLARTRTDEEGEAEADELTPVESRPAPALGSFEPREAPMLDPLLRWANGTSACRGMAAKVAEGPKGKLVQGVIDLTFHHAAGAVVKRVLEMDGYEVEQVTLPHEGMYKAAADGKVDFLLGWFEGSHGVYLDSFRERAVVLNRVYEPFCYWGVPDYVPEEEVAEIADLAKPEVAATFEKVIQGITPGAGISRFSKQAVEDYGLAAQGFEFRCCKERPEECFDAYEAAVAAGKRVVIPHYHPQYLHAKYKIRMLRDPKNIMRGHVKDNCSPVLLKTSLAAGKLQPRTLTILRNVYLSNMEVSKLDYDLCINKMSPDEAARKWMAEHEDRVAEWFDKDTNLLPEERIHTLGIDLPSNLPAELRIEKFVNWADTGILTTPLVQPWLDDGVTLMSAKDINHQCTNDKARCTFVCGHIARRCAINALALIKRHVEDVGKALADVRVQHIEAYSTFDMHDPHLDVDDVMDHVTDLFIDSFGESIGVHSRTIANLPPAHHTADPALSPKILIRVLFTLHHYREADA